MEVADGIHRFGTRMVNWWSSPTPTPTTSASPTRSRPAPTPPCGCTSATPGPGCAGSRHDGCTCGPPPGRCRSTGCATGCWPLRTRPRSAPGATGRSWTSPAGPGPATCPATPAATAPCTWPTTAWCSAATPWSPSTPIGSGAGRGCSSRASRGQRPGPGLPRPAGRAARGHAAARARLLVTGPLQPRATLAPPLKGPSCSSTLARSTGSGAS
jgi:hypothetical protein